MSSLGTNAPCDSYLPCVGRWQIYVIRVMWWVIVPHSIRPCCTRMNAMNVASKEFSALPSVSTARNNIAVRMTVLTNRLSEQGECSEKLSNAVMTHNPFTRTNSAQENIKVVTKATVVTECIKGQDPAIVGITLLLSTDDLLSTC